jgi:hypothetical protein
MLEIEWQRIVAPADDTPSQLIKRGRVGRMRTRKTRRQKSQGYKYYCQKRN